MSSSLRRLGRIATMLAVGTLALAACGGGDESAGPTTADTDTPASGSADPTTSGSADPTTSTTTTATAPTTPAAAADAAPTAVPAALDFTAPLVGGGEIEMGALAGRPVLLWFWAPW